VSQSLAEMRTLIGEVVTIILDKPGVSGTYSESTEGVYAIGRLTAVTDHGEAVYVDQISGLVHHAWPALEVRSL
jgi:hypothetical protein